MRSEQVRIQPYTDQPTRQQPRVLPSGEAALGSPAASEEAVARLLAGCPQIVIDGLAGGLSEFKFDRPSSFLLADACPVGCITTQRAMTLLSGVSISSLDMVFLAWLVSGRLTPVKRRKLQLVHFTGPSKSTKLVLAAFR